jgi:hypothetical protein
MFGMWEFEMSLQEFGPPKATFDRMILHFSECQICEIVWLVVGEQPTTSPTSAWTFIPMCCAISAEKEVRPDLCSGKLQVVSACHFSTRCIGTVVSSV